MFPSMAEYFKIESAVWGYYIFKDGWSAVVGTLWLHLFFQPWTVPSLRGQSGQIWAKTSNST